MTTTLGLDIGGANLKAADPDGRVRSVEFPMWTRHRQLTGQLQQLSWVPRPDLVGVTMTAELADCFECRAEGVRHVIGSVQQAFPESQHRFWLTTGEFAEPQDAVELPELVAAANWHALATWVGRAVPRGPAILIDVGSTTSDIIPLLDGLPVACGLNDLERLQHGELVYTGIRRTPLCAVRRSVTVEGVEVPVAAELFATMLDVHTLLGSLAEEPVSTGTADGRPATVPAARRRIARMLCCDQSELSGDAVRQIAQQFADAQRGHLLQALQRVRDRLASQWSAASQEQRPAVPQVIVSGSGEFLATAVASEAGLTTNISLQKCGSAAIAEAACAFAVARLVVERCRDDLLAELSFEQPQA